MESTITVHKLFLLPSFDWDFPMKCVIFILSILVSLATSCTQSVAKPNNEVDLQLLGCLVYPMNDFATAEKAVEAIEAKREPKGITALQAGNIKAQNGRVYMVIGAQQTSMTLEGTLSNGSLALQLEPYSQIAFGISGGVQKKVAVCKNTSNKTKVFHGSWASPSGKLKPYTGNILPTN